MPKYLSQPSLISAFLLFFFFVFVQGSQAASHVSALIPTTCETGVNQPLLRITLQSQRTEFTPGSTLKIHAILTNDGTVPIANGSLFVKIFKGEDVVDQFPARENVHLKVGESTVTDFSWTIPAYAANGTYSITPVFFEQGRFLLAGEWSRDILLAGSFTFSVVNASHIPAALDRTSVTANGTKVLAQGKPLVLSAASPVKVSFRIRNTSKSTAFVPVQGRLYAGNITPLSMPLEVYDETATVPAGGTTEVTFLLSESKADHLTLQLESRSEDTKSFVSVPLYFTNERTASFVSVFPKEHPATPGLPLEVQICVDGGSQVNGVHGRIDISLTDNEGDIVEQSIFSGFLPYGHTGFKMATVSFHKQETYHVLAELYVRDTPTDQVTLTYFCREMICASSGKIPSKLLSVAAVLVGLLLVFSLFLYHRRHTAAIVVFLFVFCILPYGASAEYQTFGVGSYTGSIDYRTSVQGGTSITVGSTVSFQHNEYVGWSRNDSSGVGGFSTPGSCGSGTYVGWLPGNTFFFGYLQISTVPLTSVTHSGTAQMSCSADGRTCTALSPGTISSVYHFGGGSATMHSGLVPETQGAFPSNTCSWLYAGSGSYGGKDVIGPTVTVQAPPPSANRPPSTPVIANCPEIQLRASTPYGFRFSSSDPDNDDLTFVLTWDGGSPMGTGRFLGSPATDSESRSFAAGQHTLRVSAQDRNGNRSGLSGICNIGVESPPLSGGGGGGGGGNPPPPPPPTLCTRAFGGSIGTYPPDPIRGCDLGDSPPPPPPPPVCYSTDIGNSLPIIRTDTAPAGYTVIMTQNINIGCNGCGSGTDWLRQHFRVGEKWAISISNQGEIDVSQFFNDQAGELVAIYNSTDLSDRYASRPAVTGNSFSAETSLSRIGLRALKAGKETRTLYLKMRDNRAIKYVVNIHVEPGVVPCSPVNKQFTVEPVEFGEVEKDSTQQQQLRGTCTGGCTGWGIELERDLTTGSPFYTSCTDIFSSASAPLCTPEKPNVIKARTNIPGEFIKEVPVSAQFSDNSTLRATARIHIKVKGQNPPPAGPPQLSTTDLHFGNVVRGSTVTGTFDIKNCTGCRALTWTMRAPSMYPLPVTAPGDFPNTPPFMQSSATYPGTEDVRFTVSPYTGRLLASGGGYDQMLGYYKREIDVTSNGGTSKITIDMTLVDNAPLLPPDLCVNISDTQTTVPTDRIAQGASCVCRTGTHESTPPGGVCVPDNPIDVCLNIIDTQTTLPSDRVANGTSCLCPTGTHEVSAGGACVPDAPTTIDIGLRIFNGSRIIAIAAQPRGNAPLSPVRVVGKDGLVYSIPLVVAGVSDDSGIRIGTASGIKGLQKYTGAITQLPNNVAGIVGASTAFSQPDLSFLGAVIRPWIEFLSR